jgi:thiol-disulfide isomerase/thioredoxin
MKRFFLTALAALGLGTAPAADPVAVERAELGGVTFSQATVVGEPTPELTLVFDEHPDRSANARLQKHWIAYLSPHRKPAALSFDGKAVAPADFLKLAGAAKRVKVEFDTLPNEYGRVAAIRATTVAQPYRKPVLLKVTADWCEPCQRLKKSMEQVPAVVMNRYEVVILDCTKYRTAGSKYGVTSLPTLIVFQDDQEVRRESGFQTADQLTDWLAPVPSSNK